MIAFLGLLISQSQAVFAGRRQSRTSAWLEYLRRKMERGEKAREEDEMGANWMGFNAICLPWIGTPA